MANQLHPLTLGINAAYHECSAAIARGGEIVFAAEEERFTRVKHGKAARVNNPDQLPWHAIRACLRAAVASLSDLDGIGYSLMPGRRLSMVNSDPYAVEQSFGFGTAAGEREFDKRVSLVPALLAKAAEDEKLSARVHFLPHHECHAAATFYNSPFASASVMVVDGIGEDATAWLGRGTEDGLQLLEEIPYPHSLGFLWERVALYLGFGEYDACKVMGLAAYGNLRRFAQAFDKLLVVPDPNGGTIGSKPLPFVIDPRIARFRAADVAGLETLFGPRRRPDEPPETARFADVAAALQDRTEQALLATARRLFRATRENNLAYGGGVALNCAANAQLERRGPFTGVYILGAANDAGTAVGAALELSRMLVQETGGKWRPAMSPLTPLLGASYSATEIDNAISQAGLTIQRITHPESLAASLLAEGQIVGWFQGRFEFGPRALGSRSLLADPRRGELREALNRRVKHRERFRPFAGSILADEATNWFEFPTDRAGAYPCRDLMLIAYPVKPTRKSLIPAVLHEDDTCRLQLVYERDNPSYYRLIKEFQKLTGVPIVLNTSFNDQEPLVASPIHAVNTFCRTRIDALFMGDRLVTRNA